MMDSRVADQTPSELRRIKPMGSLVGYILVTILAQQRCLLRGMP
jgi:hypothetical protein